MWGLLPAARRLGFLRARERKQCWCRHLLRFVLARNFDAINEVGPAGRQPAGSTDTWIQIPGSCSQQVYELLKIGREKNL